MSSDSGHLTIPDVEPEPNWFARKLDGLSGITGRKIPGTPTDPNAVGLLGSIATESRVKAAGRYWPELELQAHNDDLYSDGLGIVYRRVLSDPLLADEPGKQDVSGYAISDGAMNFFRRSSNPATVDELEAAGIATQRSIREAEEAHQRFIAEQDQVVVQWPQARCELRESITAIESHGGRFAIGPHQELVVTLPQQLIDFKDGYSPLDEGAARQSLVPHLEAVSHCAKVLVSVLATSSKKPLSSRVPSGYPTLGGGLS